MKKASLLSILLSALTLSVLAEPTVYFTSEISPESLVRIFNWLGCAPQASDTVAVKISTGEAGGHNYLKPELISNLVAHVNGTIVECNTAYRGKRNTSEAHWQTIRDHGFTAIAKVDLMDEHGEIEIPVRDTTHIKSDLVGASITNYAFMVNLAHFKGHQMGGFGGVLKNQSIGVASANGKARIHTAGATDATGKMWANLPAQDAFLESMAAAAQAVHDYFGGTNIVYVNVLNNLSVDCDCSAHPAAPKMKDLGVMASLDPVALDQAAFDMVSGVPVQENDDNRDLLARIAKQHGTHIIDYAEKIGLGSKQYTLVDIDKLKEAAGVSSPVPMTVEAATSMIRQKQAECVLLSGEPGARQFVTRECGHGVSPLMKLHDRSKDTLKGMVLVDKVIGRAAAFIAIDGKAAHVHGMLMSEDAVELLAKHKITVSFDKLVPRILNKRMDGLCPLENSVLGKEDVAEAMASLRARIADLASGKFKP